MDHRAYVRSLGTAQGRGEEIAVSSSGTQVSRVSLTDVDAFSEWEIGLGWDIESTQLTAGSNEIQFDHFLFPDLLLGHFCAKRSMENTFAVPDGVVVFLICREKLPAYWCGRHIPPTHMVVMRSGREQWAVLPGGWDCYEFMVSEELIRRTEIFPAKFFAQTVHLERAVLPLVEPVTGQFLRHLECFFRDGRGANGSSGIALHEARFLDFVIHGLVEVIDAGLKAAGTDRVRAARRPDLVLEARDFVAAHLTTDFSMEDLSRALGTSYRALNYAFKDTLGTSPYKYVLTQKLHAVRRQLRAGASVSTACFALGFDTPSRFARQYSRLFGELPSKTRRANGVQKPTSEGFAG